MCVYIYIYIYINFRAGAWEISGVSELSGSEPLPVTAYSPLGGSETPPVTAFSPLGARNDRLKHRQLPHIRQWAPEMAARACLGVPRRSKWPLGPASECPERSKWPLEPASERPKRLKWPLEPASEFPERSKWPLEPASESLERSKWPLKPASEPLCARNHSAKSPRCVTAFCSILLEITARNRSAQ